jgi:outer membrane protein TolC
MCGKPIAAKAWIGWILLLACGCQTPFDNGEKADQSLHRSVADAVERELATAGAEDIEGRDGGENQVRHLTTQPPSEVEEALSRQRVELDAMSPTRTSEDPAQLGPDLNNNQQRGISLSLKDAIRTSVANNLSVQDARLQPAISSADVVAAEAVFDALLFSSADFSWTNERTADIRVNGQKVNSPADVQNVYRFNTGLRKQLTTGGQVSLSTSQTSDRNKSPQISLSPNPAFNSDIRLGLTQPLLRGFGSDVNRASIMLAENQERRSIQGLRDQLLETVEETELAYWNLVYTWHELAIRRWLVEVGIQVRDVLALRRDFDTRLAQYSDAVARVEQRKANVIRAQRSIRAASDELKVLINDRDVTIGSELVYLPIDKTIDAPISYSLLDVVLTAVTERPDIQAAILDIDDASIRQLVANNGRLPMLDLNAEVAFTGLGKDFGEAYGQVFRGSYTDYVLGLLFESPIGNRAAEAEYRKARLLRSSAVISYRRSVQDAVAIVKDQLRNVVTNFELIAATRDNRLAQAENLRALLVEEETLASLTPEFLNLKFQRQDRLADACSEEIQALVNFDQSVAALYRAMGIGLKMNGIDIDIIEGSDYEAGITPMFEPDDASQDS